MLTQKFQIPVSANNVIARNKQVVNTSGFRFPTTKEVEQIIAEIAPSIFDQPNSLLDRMFTTESTTASEIEVYVMRSSMGAGGGMTLVHQLGSNALPMDVRASKFDLSKASWSPIAFKESKTWEEKEMLLLGRLTEEVAASEIDGQVAEYIEWMLKRMKNRRDWMLWQVLQTGKVVIDATDQYNPSGITYTVDYLFTDMQLALTNKFDQKDGTGKSLTDPVAYFEALTDAAKYKPEKKPVLIITNSAFIDVLTDNTFIQYLADYERGYTLTEMRPPRSVYKQVALDIFKRYTGIQVEINDSTYEDALGQVKFWIPTGKMIVVNQNTNPVGKMVYTGHVSGISETGAITIGTGPYVQVDDRSRKDAPRYSILGGFHGLPKVEGYSNIDFSLHRIKWLDYATVAAEDYLVEFPTVADRYPLGAQKSPFPFGK